MPSKLPRSIVASGLMMVALAATVVTVSPAPAPAPVSIAQEEPQEDEPGFDCRFHGNKECGVFFEGQWQVISYDAAGQPVRVTPRGF